MSTGTNKMIGNFAGKPKTQAFFSSIAAYLHTLGPSKHEVKAQVSYSINRKFLWLWAYEKTPDGTLYLTVCLDKKIENPHFRYVTQVSKNRWNHHVEVTSLQIANSAWLHRLIDAGYKFAKTT